MILKTLGNRNFGLSLLACVSFCVALLLHKNFERPLLKVSKQDSMMNLNQDFVRIFSIGNKKLISDLLWVQTLLESDLEKYSGKDLGNWMYIRFHSISVLDPLFYENYLYGGQYLSIVKDDLEGAATIYERGLKHFPDDYALNYNAGFNLFFEMNKPKEGLRKLEKIKTHPLAPPQISSIIHKLQLELGELSLQNLMVVIGDRYNSTKDPSLRAKLWGDLYSIKAEIDLDCLNGKKNGPCAVTDLNNHPYLKDRNGVYRTKDPFVKYRLKKKRGS